MERRQFLKNAGTAGLCSCLVARAFGAEAAPTTAEKPKPAEDGRIKFAKERYSKLITLVAARVDEKTFREIVEEVGRFCADSGFSKKFAGQLESYLAEIEKRWHAKTSYDANSQIVQLSFQPQTKDCACPLMGKGLVPAAACRCSVGSMQRSFATIVGREVAVELKESILQGGESCSFEIRLKTA
jgi:hypothetical protein